MKQWKRKPRNETVKLLQSLHWGLVQGPVYQKLSFEALTLCFHLESTWWENICIMSIYVCKINKKAWPGESEWLLPYKGFPHKQFWACGFLEHANYGGDTRYYLAVKSH